MKKEYAFAYEVYENVVDLLTEDAGLLKKAQDACLLAYAPYSEFQVGAAARLANGAYIASANQENASFPVGLCAERGLLATATAQYPGVRIDTIAVSYRSTRVLSNHPISPCGICRQSLVEYEQRFKHPIRLILGGLEGLVYIVPNAGMLLPLSFTSADMK